MTYSTYKLIHLSGVLMVFLSFGGLIVRGFTTGKAKELKSLCSITNGIGMMFVLVGGFGLVVKLGTGFPGWVIGKLTIWAVFAGLISIINRKPSLGKPLWWTILLLGVAAIFLAIFKPF